MTLYAHRNALRLFLAVIVLFASLAATITPTTAQPVGPGSPGWQRDYVEIVVELMPGESPDEFAPYFLGRLNVPVDEHADRINHVYEHAIVGFSVYLTPQEANAARQLFGSGQYGVQVLLEAPFMSVPDLSLFGIGPGSVLPTTRLGPDLVIPTNILRTEASLPESPGQYSDIDIAVLDTGIDRSHPLLNVVGGIDCTAEPDERDSYGIDPYGHGTHVAGTIAARYTDTGIVGFAPGARLWDVRVLDERGGGNLAGIICGVDFVAAQGIPIANMSLGGAMPQTECNGPDPLHNAICLATEQGTIFVVSAGNAGADAANFVPASYPEVVAVSAFADFDGRPGRGALTPADRCAAASHDDELAAFSNYGPLVKIAAPGVCILSTLPGDEAADGAYTPRYGYLSGTSMSAPAVSGALARYLAVNRGDVHQENAVAHLIAWSADNGTSDRYDGSHSDAPAPLLYIGPDGIPRWAPTEPDEFPDPANITR